MTSVRDRIGSLADRLRERYGRSFGHCRTCGNPTRSHRLGDGLQCHTCHVDDRGVLLTDGGGESSAECFRCGAPATITFGNAYLCEDCVPESGDDSEPENSDDERDRDLDRDDDAADVEYAPTGPASIPDALADWGQAFAPVQPGEKRCYHSREREDLYAPDDDDLQIYLHSGFNYAAVTHGQRVAIDVDEPDALAEAVEQLPETAWQVTGSRESEAYFCYSPGLDSDIPLDDPETGENLGHIKAADKSYVVGPGSRHPSGNRYGPLRGDEIATIDESELREIFEPYISESQQSTSDDSPELVENPTASGDRDSPLDVDDVLLASSYSEGERTEHPFHGSETGANFMVDQGGETWRCWRHDCTGNALHLVGIEQGVISCGEWTAGGLPSETWSEIFDAAREAGYDLPEWDPALAPEWVDDWLDEQPLVDRDDLASDGFDGLDRVSLLPISRLDSLEPDEVRRYAKKRGLDWPTTSEARQRLEDRLFTALRHQEDVVIDAPTSLGKSHTSATTPWRQHADITGEQPVIHLSETREARDQSYAKSQAAGVSTFRLLGRDDACPVAAGDHDPADDDDRDGPEKVVTMNGAPGSEYLTEMCDDRRVPFSSAHAYLAEHHDQQHEHLPCCVDDEGNPRECRAMAQWDEIPRDDDGNPTHDQIHATHNFAHVPGLAAYTNIVFDERPDFTVDLETDRVQRCVAAFLKEVDAPVTSWEQFVSLARDGYAENPHGDVVSERDAVRDALDREPEREWYLEAEHAHTLAPSLAKAVWWALADEPTSTGRYAARVPHEPPRLDANARDDDDWNREWLSIVLDEDHRVRTVRCAPDLSSARCVIGLDAHPCTPLWQQNTKPGIVEDELLDARERALWRRVERGLLVVQVGDADRPLTSGEYFDERGTRAMIEQLHDGFDGEFRTAITSAAVEDDTREIMRDVGIDDPETMHYGEEKSRDDFGGERVGLANGCIDPGDGYVLDLLAERGHEAEPETTDHGERAHGRGFVGPDADTARALLASVRENHVAQGAGRYARNADDPDDHAIVFVRTAAVPTGFADLQVPGVEWVATEQQRRILEELRDAPGATARELAEGADCSKKHVADTLGRLDDADLVRAREGVGDYGATVYRLLSDQPPSGVVDLGQTPGPRQTANDHVWNSYTWSFAIDAPALPSQPRVSRSQRANDGPGRKQSSFATFDGGDRPPTDGD